MTGERVETVKKTYDYRTATNSDTLWVINMVGRTSGGIRRPTGGLVISIVTNQGKYERVNILNTPIPQDLSAQELAPAIVSSRDFRSLVAAGLLKVVSPEEAERQLSTASAQAELRRIADFKNSKDRFASGGRDNPTMGGGIEPGAPGSYAQSPGGEQMHGGMVMGLEQNSTHNIDRPNVGLAMLDRYRHNELSLEQAIASLEGLKFMLNEVEKEQLRSVTDLPQDLMNAISSI